MKSNPSALSVIGYCRCSTDTQDDSIDTQEQLIRRECDSRGYRLVDVYRDPAISAGTTPLGNRPEGKRLLADVQSKLRRFDAVMVLRMDRLFRDRLDELPVIAYIMKCGVQVISIKDPIDLSTATGRLQHGIMMEFRQYEREITGQRIREHNLAMALRKEWPGGPAPLGLTYDKVSKKVVANDRAADALTVFRLYVETNGSARKTAVRLNELGMRAGKGGPFSSARVLEIVRSRAYRQEIQYGDVRVSASETIERVIPEELALQVDRLLSQTRVMAPRQIGSVYPHSGLMRCSECGWTWAAHSATNATGSKSLGWRCVGKSNGACPCKGLGNLRLQDMTTRALQRLLSQCKESVAADDIAGEIAPARPVSTHQARKRLQDQRSAVLRQHELGVIADDQLVERIRAIDSEIEKMETPEDPAPCVSVAEVFSMLSDITETWGEKDDASRRAFLLAIGARFTICTAATIPWMEMTTDLGLPPVRVEQRVTMKWKKRRGLV